MVVLSGESRQWLFLLFANPERSSSGCQSRKGILPWVTGLQAVDIFSSQPIKAVDIFSSQPIQAVDIFSSQPIQAVDIFSSQPIHIWQWLRYCKAVTCSG